MYLVKPKVIVIDQRTVVIDIIIGMGNSVRRPCWLKAGGTESDHVAVIHEYLYGTVFV
jgi:hypothetical protein